MLKVGKGDKASGEIQKRCREGGNKGKGTWENTKRQVKRGGPLYRKGDTDCNKRGAKMNGGEIRAGRKGRIL